MPRNLRPRNKTLYVVHEIALAHLHSPYQSLHGCRFPDSEES